ncbi:hypothetical protein EFA69_07655 [Rufibacter immobilis]|uniref:Uncharacterized protein n=1 Tax=Rufibacter immobilis TaxID=1348778 RepID=A0A3M9MV95_9BACT|nr:hypothetical protein EFA69_07655 [Rufibacter immobilis]
MVDLTIVVLWMAFGISFNLKVYYHFLLFKKKKSLNITLFDIYFNPFSLLYSKLFIFFPFYLFKSEEVEIEYKRLRRLIIVYSWISFSCFIILAGIALYLENYVYNGSH